MNERSFERRAQHWLESGPTKLPEHAIDLVMDAIADVPQQRGLIRRLPRRIRAWHGGMLAAAAVVVLAVSGISALLATSFLRDFAGPRPADHLLHDFPEARTSIERSGGPATGDERVSIGKLPSGRIFVVAASCEGSDHMTVAVYDPSIIYGEPEDGAPVQPEPTHSLEVACGEKPQHTRVDSLMGAGSLDLVLDVAKGTTWRVAVGEYPGETAKEPTFSPPVATDGWYLLMEVPPMLVLGHPGPGIGIQVPEGATEIGILVQCAGDPITVSTDAGSDTVPIDCSDPAVQQRVTFPAQGLGFGVHAGSNGIAWVRMTPEADGEITTARPSAPPLPAGLEAVGFADGDGQYVAFGTLGTDDQTVIAVPGALVGLAGGDVVGVARAADDGSGMRLEAWSVKDASPIRTLAETDGRIFDSWVDTTHGQVFYGVAMDDLSAEWHRAGTDGSGDVAIVTMPSTVIPSGIASGLAMDDSEFVVEWCPLLGSCTRHIYDTVTGATREIRLDGERTCQLFGVIEGRVVASTATTCDGTVPERITIQDLDGGERHALPVPNGSAILAMTADGPVVLVAEHRTDETNYRVVNLDGSEPREIVRIAHPEGVSPSPSALRLPAGWVLLAGPLADTPTNRNLGRAVPRLLNVETGELIELVNLPNSGS